MSDIPPPPPPAPPPGPVPPPVGAGWEPPGGAAPPPAPGPNRSMLLLVLGGLLVVGVGAVVLLGGGDDDTGPEAAGGTSVPELGELPDVPDLDDPGDLGGSEDDEGGDGGGPAPTGGATPEAAVQGYIDAVVAADCGAMVAHLTENMLVGMDRDLAVEDCESTAENQPEMAAVMSALELGPADEEGGVATIQAHADYEGSPLIVVFTLVQDGEAWLIDNVA